MARNVSESVVALNRRTVSVANPRNPLGQKKQQQFRAEMFKKNKSQKLSAFKDRGMIQKKINNLIKDKNWVKNLTKDEQIYEIFGMAWVKNMAMLSKIMIEQNAEYVDRF